MEEFNCQTKPNLEYETVVLFGYFEESNSFTPRKTRQRLHTPQTLMCQCLANVCKEKVKKTMEGLGDKGIIYI